MQTAHLMHLTEMLADFSVDPVRGFLPAQDPVRQLPAYYAPWERTITVLPMLLTADMTASAIERLPLLATDRLETNGQVERAMLLLSLFASAYVWEQEVPKTNIPHPIAQPLWNVAEILERPPILSYTSLVLHNWRSLDHFDTSNADLQDDAGCRAPTLRLDNLALQHCFWGGLDEQWFYLISVAIEAAGAPALLALSSAQHAVAHNQIDPLGESLRRIHTVLTDIYTILLRLPEKCHPYIFYHRIRRFIGGWPRCGVLYEGVSQTPHTFVGSSGAQSALLQALDAGLDIAHSDEQSAYLTNVRPYMQRGHRRFIQALAEGPSVRDYVMANRVDHPALRDGYNSCIEMLDRFRKKHLEIAAQYIAQQAPKQTIEAQMGTGGTPFISFLSHMRKETQDHLIQKETLYEVS